MHVVGPRRLLLIRSFIVSGREKLREPEMWDPHLLFSFSVIKLMSQYDRYGYFFILLF